MPPKLGILAGGGVLPSRLIEACHEQGREVFVIAFEDYAIPEALTGIPHEWVRLGAGGKTLELLKENDVEELVMAGPVKRPSLSAMRPDAWSIKFLARASINSLGDDGLLRAIVKELEKEGFKVVGIEEVMSSLIAKKKIYGQIEPDQIAWRDIEKGFQVAWALGKADVGQAVVIQQELVLALEAIEGTASMLKRIPEVSREGPQGVLVKAKKPQQEKRADLPTIGPDTIRQASEAGLRGVAIEAEGALVIDPEKTTELANQLGLFVVGYSEEGASKA